MLAGDYFGAWAADYEMDGDLDIVLAPRAGPPVLLRNNRDGTFKVIQPFGGVKDVRAFVWADLDNDGASDAAFLDADKSSYPIYLDECLRIVRRGGLIMVDNAFAFGQLLAEHPTDREVAAVRAFNDYMAGVKSLQGIIVPIGDGVWVAVKQ